MLETPNNIKFNITEEINTNELFEVTKKSSTSAFRGE
jgi:hypothetical protein